MDLGYYKDDYVGCDSSLDAGFTYNGDNYDDLPFGYGAHPPMQNIEVLKGPLADVGDGIDNNHNGTIDEPGERCMMNHFMYFNNDANSINGNPDTATGYYSYLKSLWKDSSYVLDCNANITNYMFNGEPYCGTGCTEASFVNFPDERRFIMSSGPFSLSPVRKQQLTLLMYFHGILYLRMDVQRQQEETLQIYKE